MKIQVLVGDSDVTSTTLVDGLEITQNITDRVSQASVKFMAQTGQAARYDEANYDEDFYSVDIQEYYDIKILDRDTGVKKFAGTIRQIKPVRKASQILFYECDCLDWSSLLDDAYIIEENFGSASDRSIIQFLVAKYAPGLTALTDNISQIVTLPSWSVEEKTLRQALDEIVEFSGGEWRIDWDKNLHYFLPSENPAPFGFSSSPNSVTSVIGLTWDAANMTWNTIDSTWDEAARLETLAAQGILVWDDATQTWTDIQGTWDDPGTPPVNAFPSYGIDALADYSKDAIKIINRAVVLGAAQGNGARLKSTYDDPISQLEYGIRSHTVVDDQLTIGYNAGLRAKAIVDENAYPKETINLRTFIDGLEVGQTLPIYHADYSINGSYIIRELKFRQITRSLTEYELSCGAREPDTLRVLRQIEARSRRLTSAPRAIPADGSVTDASITLGGISANVIGSVNAGTIIGTIQAHQIGSVNAAVIAGVVSANQISTVNASSIQGVIEANQIGSVSATTIEGVIVSDQLADGLLNKLSLYADAFRPIPNRPSHPALPNDDYPLYSYYYNTTTGKFYRNDLGVWNEVPEGTAVVGKLEYYHIGTVKAEKIVGLIVANQIDTITAGQIVGQITANQIETISFSQITGQIVATQIATVNAGSIQGTISSGQIASLTADKITGTLSASQIGTINASAITGTISASQIGSVNAASITIGLVQDGQIGNINAGKLTTGTLNAALVNVTNLNANNITTGALSASRIGAGTISASITITAPTINGGSITGANYSITGPPYTVTLNASGLILTDPADPQDSTGVIQYGIYGTRDGTPRFNLDYQNFGGRLALFNSGGGGRFEINLGAVYLSNGALAGTASPLPGAPAGYLFVTIDGIQRRIAFWG
jgi:hypothetical protein